MGGDRRHTWAGADDGGADVQAEAWLAGDPARLDGDEALEEGEEGVGVELLSLSEYGVCQLATTRTGRVALLAERRRRARLSSGRKRRGSPSGPRYACMIR